MIYRALGEVALQAGLIAETTKILFDEIALDKLAAGLKLPRAEDSERLRNEQIALAASIVATSQLVRATLVAMQRDFRTAPPTAVGWKLGSRRGAGGPRHHDQNFT